MQNYADILKNLSPSQLQKLQKISQKIKTNPNQATHLIKNLGIDIKQLKKTVNSITPQKPKIKKLKPNEKCHCGSDKKYKYCCYLA